MAKNPYESLLIDNRAKLPKPWENYPVLQPGQFEIATIYVDGREHAKIYIGRQGSMWVVGNDYLIGSRGGCCYPGRKWGEFASSRDAMLWALGNLLALDTDDEPLPTAAVNAIHKQIFELRQYKLF